MAVTVQAPRSGEQGDPQRRERRWLPLFGVVAGLLLLVGGGYAAAGVLSEPAGPPIRVAGVVTVQPLSGWSLAGRGRLGTSGPMFARLTRGGGSVDVIAYPGVGGTAGSLAATYTRELENPLTRLSVSSQLEPVHTAAGLQGVRFSYAGVIRETSTPIDGEVTVIVGPSGNGAIFDGWAPAGLLSYASGDIGSMIQRAVIV